MNGEKRHTRFGFEHICGIILVAASILLIVGLFVEPPAVSLAGFALFAVGSAMLAARRYVSVSRTVSGSPEFRTSLTVAIAMTVTFVLSVVGFVFKLTFII